MKPRAQRIVRISRVVGDLTRSETFYRDALGFETISRNPAVLTFSAGNAEEVVMRLGTATIALVRFETPAGSEPMDGRSNDLWFQHMAIVVGDMDAAYAHLARASGWRPISTAGPEQLPPTDGGVRAFKFRDVDGHPLELIWFPSGRAGGDVDHTALAVSSNRRSVEFYRALGFRVTHRSLNQGPAQDRLDAIADAHVQVTALRPEADTGPGLELLGYIPPGRAMPATQSNGDWITLEVATLSGERYRRVRDPDGHRLLLVDQGSGVPA